MEGDWIDRIDWIGFMKVDPAANFKLLRRRYYVEESHAVLNLHPVPDSEPAPIELIAIECRGDQNFT